MSEIFKIVLLKPNQQSITYTFDILNKHSKSINKKHMSIPIYRDDTIQRIKEKIYIFTDIKISLSEMYLFKKNKVKFNNENIYKKLIQDNSFELDTYRLRTFLNNSEKNIDNFKDEFKGIYSYDDLTNILNKHYKDEQMINNSIGHDIIYNTSMSYIVNPYELINMDMILDNNEANIITKNKKLLLEFNEIEENTLYLCSAEDVLNWCKTKEKITEEYILKVYYPQLYRFNNIDSLDKLLEKKTELRIQVENKVDKINNIENKLNYLNSLYKSQIKDKSLLKKNSIGITDIVFTIYPTSTVNLTLETIFKILHANSDIPLIKYNSNYGDNLYRLYTDNYVSITGKKIPSLFVENNNRIIKIKQISKNIASKNKIGFYIPYNEEVIREDIFCDFLDNGNIIVHIESKSNPKTINEIEEIVREKINKNILEKINEFTRNVGYVFTKFIDFYEDNIEINNIEYSYLFKNDKDVDLNKYISCLSPIFNITNGILNDKSSIDLMYKRVSNYQEMSSVNAYITSQRQQNKDIQTVILNIKHTFDIDKETAIQYFANWQSEIQMEVDKFENKKIKILDNPGFDIKIIRKDYYSDTMEVCNLIKIKNINNIHYLKYIEKYVFVLIALINNNYNESDIKRYCGIEDEVKIEDSKEDNDVLIDSEEIKKNQTLIQNKSGKISFYSSDEDDMDIDDFLEDDDDDGDDDDDDDDDDGDDDDDDDDDIDGDLLLSEEDDAEDDAEVVEEKVKTKTLKKSAIELLREAKSKRLKKQFR